MFASIFCSAVLLTAAPESWVPKEFRLRNFGEPVGAVPAKIALPIVVPPFVEHVRGHVAGIDPAAAARAQSITLDATGAVVLGDHVQILAVTDGVTWEGGPDGLYRTGTDGKRVRHADYGVGGPLATRITGLAATPDGTLWAGTPLGLSRRAADGTWSHLRGREGLPVEDITALAATPDGDLWIGTSAGAILYRPDAEGRRWFYRQGPRYLPGDEVRAVAVAPDGSTAYFLTDAGVGAIQSRMTTLLAKAQTIEARVNTHHRREGMVAACVLDNAEKPSRHTIHDNDNDGLWTAYHVAAMSLAYGATQDDAAKASAREGMHALYMLQDASGIPGLVARSVVPPEIGKTKDAQWQPTPDGKWYWKSDTSSDEIDGHYLAFYTYFEHIARHDDAERKRIIEQVREVTDYIVDNGYQLIDFDGKRTRWGFWDPESLNYNPMDFIEGGLNSLQILSFLKVAHHVTGDKKYHDHYEELAIKHDYLHNVMLTKKSFPLENNHSDDQLGHVAWYPLLQLERDPVARQALLRGIAYHYEVVRPEQPSFYTFVYATINPGKADLPGAVENLRQIPADRRTWAQRNSHRADVEISAYPNRFGKPVLTRVLPADERVFEKWNADPYVPDDGGDGTLEDDGAAYLLPYWMGRYHGFIREQD